MLFQRLYELDYDTHTGEYRMTHGFMAETAGLEEATSKASHRKQKTKSHQADAMAPTKGVDALVKTAVWTRNVALHRTAWQSGAGIGAAGWLASAGFSGVVRVEAMSGDYV